MYSNRYDIGLPSESGLMLPMLTFRRSLLLLTETGAGRGIALDGRHTARDHMSMRQLLLILFLGCAACNASGPVAPSSPAKDEDAAALLIRLRSMVGTAACTETSQCKTVAVGARACGGPEGYLPYSTAVTPSGPLEALALRHAERRRTEVAASGELSTCIFIPDRGAICVAGNCQLRNAVNDPS